MKKYYTLKYCLLVECIVKCHLFLWCKLNFQHHFSSLQCHMILQKSFYVYLLLKKHFWLLSMLKTVVLLNIFVEIVIHFIFQDSLMNRKFKRTVFFEIEIVCNIVNVFTITFNQLNASLLNKSINFFQEEKKYLSDLKLLSDSIHKWFGKKKKKKKIK